MCVYVCVCVYGSISRAKSAALVPRVGRTTDGPALGLTSQRPSPALTVAPWWGAEGRGLRALSSPPPRRPPPPPPPRALSNAPAARQGWDQVQCVLMNLNQFDKYSGRKKVFVHREAFDFRSYSAYVYIYIYVMVN